MVVRVTQVALEREVVVVVVAGRLHVAALTRVGIPYVRTRVANRGMAVLPR